MELRTLPDTIVVDPENGVRLRLAEDADRDALVAACQDPEISRWTPIPLPYGPEHAQSYIDQVRMWTADGDLRRTYLIVDQADAILGTIGLVRNRPEDRTGEIGYWLAKTARGRGIATHALGALLQEVLRAGYERVCAEVIVGNDASCRVLERAGFHHEGVLRSVASHGCGDGATRIDVHSYSVVLSDPVAQRLLSP